jgi:1-acyl-sn-glycerol-3-phosphate acyltransferase
VAAPEAWPEDGLSAAPALRRLSHEVVRPVLRLLWGLKVSGVEHIPERGPVIIAGNHVSNLDGPILAVAAEERRYVHGIGKQELFKVPVLGWYLRNTGSIPLDRRGDVRAMRAAIELVASGHCLLMFPEGTRSKDGRRGPAKAGVAFVAGQTGARVVPVRVTNTDHFPPRGPVEARFGEPLTYDGDPHDRAACRAFGERVLDRVFKL